MAISKDDRNFYLGILTALEVIALYDRREIFDDIMGTVDQAEIVEVAREDGRMMVSGLTKYGYGKKYPRGDVRR